MPEMKPSPFFNGDTSTSLNGGTSSTPTPPFNGNTSTQQQTPPLPFNGDTSTQQQTPPPPFDGNTSSQTQSAPPPLQSDWSEADSNTLSAEPKVPQAEVYSANSSDGSGAVRQESQDQQADKKENKYRFFRKPDFVCPFCMSEIYTSDLLYYCKRCKKVYEEKKAKEQLRRAVKKQYYCCGNNITSERICPSCREEQKKGRIEEETLRILPSEIYHAKNEFRVCMAGYSASGKTQYITQLMDYIAKRALPGINSTYFLDNETQRIREEIRTKFFVDKQQAGTTSGYLEPLLFNIRKGKHSYISVFYDIAGEDFRENRDTLATRCIWTSKNILLIVDPSTLPDLKDHSGVKKLVSGEKASKGEVLEPLNTYLNFVRKNKSEKFLKKVNLAIVFPKMDLFYEDEDFPDILKRESSHIEGGRFDVGEVTAVSQAMENWLRSKGGDALLKALEGYSNVQIFGVSSGSLEEEKKPNRLLDPYLWLLHQNDVV